MDKRKNHGGARKGAGRKKGGKNLLSNLIQKECQNIIEKLLKNEVIKYKEVKQLSLELDLNKKNEDYLYIIENNGIYKIGYSSNWKKRKKSYETHLGSLNLIYLTKQFNCFELENKLHEMFHLKKIKKNTEWFKLNNKDILRAIKLCSELIN